MCEYVADLVHECALDQTATFLRSRSLHSSPLPGPRKKMNPIKLVAVGLIVLGVLGLAYGGFSYTKDTTVIKLGPVELSAKEKQTVNVPIWAGVGAIVVGGLLLVLGGKKR